MEELQSHDARSQYTDSELGVKPEIEGLLKRKVFEMVPAPDVPDSANVLGERFTRAINNVGTPSGQWKARHVVQGTGTGQTNP